MVDVNLPSVDDLMASGSVPSISFKDAKVGTSFTGTVTGLESVQVRDFATGDPKFWEDGKPQMQIQVTLATEYIDPAIEGDEGDRRVYLSGQKLTAAKQALKDAGLAKFEIGQKFTITLVGTKPAKTKGFNDVKLYGITLEASKSNAGVDALLAQGATPVTKNTQSAKLSAEQIAKANKLNEAGFDASEIASTLGVSEEDVVAVLTF
jgi:hypothetical protein